MRRVAIIIAISALAVAVAQPALARMGDRIDSGYTSDAKHTAHYTAANAPTTQVAPAPKLRLKKPPH